MAVLDKGHVMKLLEVETTWKLTEVTEDLSLVGWGSLDSILLALRS